MKFTVIIDRNKEEEVTVTVHQPSPLADKIEALILEYAGDGMLTAYSEDQLLQLPFSQIECITVVNGKTYAIDSGGRQYRLECFNATYSGGVNARFKSGYEEYVSRRCFAEIKRRLK